MAEENDDCWTDNIVSEPVVKTESMDYETDSSTSHGAKRFTFDGERVHICSICNIQFPIRMSLDKHILIHTNVVSQVCRAIGLQSHLENKALTPYSCITKPEKTTECPKNHTIKKDEAVDSPTQGEDTDSKEVFRKLSSEGEDDDSGHVPQLEAARLEKTMTKMETDSQDHVSSGWADKQLTGTEADFVCEADKSADTQHLPEIHAHVSRTTNKKKTYSKSRKKLHPCSICGQRCNSAAHLRAHLRIHTGEKPFCCNICKKAFARKSCLKRHTLLHEKHRSNDKDVLETKSAKSLQNLSMSCNFSNYNVQDSTNTSSDHQDASYNQAAGKPTVNQQKKIDSEEQKELRGMCLTHKNLDKLEEHSTDHDNLAGEVSKPHQVTGGLENTVAVMNNNSLDHSSEKFDKQLQRNEAEFVLSEDESQFTELLTREGINKKTTYSENGRRLYLYTCSVCDRTFKSSGHLREHIRIHTGERPFCCSICEKSFTRKSYLTKHRIAVHGKHRVTEKQNLETKTDNRSEKSTLSSILNNHSVKDSVNTSQDVSYNQPACEPAVNHQEKLDSEEQTDYRGMCLTQEKLCNQEENSSNQDEQAVKPTECVRQQETNGLENTAAVIKNNTSDHTSNKCRDTQHKGNEVEVVLDAERNAATELLTRKGISKRTTSSVNKKWTYMYPCVVCDRKFRCASHLRVHIRSHTGERPYRCSICEKSFITLSDMKKHRKVHEKRRVAQQQIIETKGAYYTRKPPGPYSFGNLLGKDSVNTSPDASDSKHTCGPTISKRDTFDSEEQTEFPGMYLAHKKHCNQEANSYDEFEMTRDKRGNKQITTERPCTENYLSADTVDEESNPPRKSELLTDTVRPEHVDITGIHPKNKYVPINKLVALCNHSVSQENDTSCHELGELKATSKVYYLEKKSMKSTACNVCGRTGIKHLSVHMRIHAAKSHPCPVCGKLFRRRALVIKHMFTHAKQKPYACEICGKQLIQLASLRRHLLAHTGEKQYICEVCGKHFKSESGFRQHISLHTLPEERQCLCDLCNKSFRNKEKLRSHVINKHFREKTFNCSYCSRTFTRRNKLKEHITIHSGEKPHECEICKKRFRDLGNFKKHLFSHSGEQPFSCKQCNKHFKRAENLRTHMLIHDGKKPHSCSICGKNFRQKGSVKLHIMRVHDKI